MNCIFFEDLATLFELILFTFYLEICLSTWFMCVRDRSYLGKAMNVIFIGNGLIG